MSFIFSLSTNYFLKYKYSVNREIAFFCNVFRALIYNFVGEDSDKFSELTKLHIDKYNNDIGIIILEPLF